MILGALPLVGCNVYVYMQTNEDVFTRESRKGATRTLKEDLHLSDYSSYGSQMQTGTMMLAKHQYYTLAIFTA